MNKQVLILGGGAAGLLAGAYLARNGLSAAILEKSPRVGKKLAATGNGRCNLTNLHASPADFGASAAFVRPALEAFQPQSVMALFEEMGVVCVPDEEGRVYPMSNQASSVLDVLRAEFAEHGGEEITDFSIDRLSRKGDLWHVHAADGRTMTAPHIIVALGGQAAPNLGGTPDGLHLLRDLGYRTKPCFPALTPLKCDHPRLKSLKGIRAAGSVALVIDEKIVASETGEILFQDYGLSGIAVMQLSGAAAQALSRQKRVSLRLNLCGLSKRKAFALLCQRRERLSARPLENFLKDEVLKIQDEMLTLFDTLQSLSERYKDVLLPGYTHGQVAMPSSFGLWFGAYAEALADDMYMVRGAREVTDQNPLGSAAGYGSSFPLDRQMTTDLLGFSSLDYNVVAAQLSRGKAERAVASAMGAVALTLNKFAADCCMYMSPNYGFIKFPDELTTGSSIMPHKKNPDVWEIMRGNCNRIMSAETQISMMCSNMPHGYHREFQLLKDILFPALELMHSCLRMADYMLQHIMVNENILDAPIYEYLFTVEEVNRRTLEGMPFRDAYKSVGIEVNEGRFHQRTALNRLLHSSAHDLRQRQHGDNRQIHAGSL